MYGFNIIIYTGSDNFERSCRSMAGFLQRCGLEPSQGRTILIGKTLPDGVEALLPSRAGIFLKMSYLRTEIVLDTLLNKSLDSDALSKGNLFLFPNGTEYEELAVRLSVRLKGSSMTDVQDIAEQETELSVRRKIYSGHILGCFQMDRAPFFISLAKGLPESDPSGGTISETVTIDASDPLQAEDCEFSPDEKTGGLEEAAIVVAGGRGLRSKANAEELTRLADQIGAAVGGSRPAVMNAWLPLDRLIGVSGSMIRPELCIVCAASGAPAFYSGIESSKTIIAVNNDESAPIMKKSDAFVCADWKEIMTELARLCQKQDAVHAR